MNPMDPSHLRELLEARFPAAPGWEGEGLSAEELEQLQAAIDADPALLAELTRIEAWDVELDRAFHDLSVPAELSERLLAAVQAPPPLAPIAADVASPPAQSNPVVLAPMATAPTTRPARRTWLVVAAGLAIATLVAVGIALSPARPPLVDAESLLAEARSLIQGLDEAAWQDDLQAAPQAVYPATPSLLLARPLRWQALATSLDRHAVVYDLMGAGRKQAVLMVLRAPRAHSNLGALPIRTPASTTEGFCLGAWQQGDLVYVLVVQGSAARYGSFIKEVSTG